MRIAPPYGRLREPLGNVVSASIVLAPSDLAHAELTCLLHTHPPGTTIRSRPVRRDLVSLRGSEVKNYRYVDFLTHFENTKRIPLHPSGFTLEDGRVNPERSRQRSSERKTRSSAVGQPGRSNWGGRAGGDGLTIAASEGSVVAASHRASGARICVDSRERDRRRPGSARPPPPIAGCVGCSDPDPRPACSTPSGAACSAPPREVDCPDRRLRADASDGRSPRRARHEPMIDARTVDEDYFRTLGRPAVDRGAASEFRFGRSTDLLRSTIFAPLRVFP